MVFLGPQRIDPSAGLVVMASLGTMSAAAADEGVKDVTLGRMARVVVRQGRAVGRRGVVIVVSVL
jgi:hypothetical protein